MATHSSSLGSFEQLRDPNYTPPLAQPIPLGIQHVLAMFVSNVTPAIIIVGAAGFGFRSNSPGFPNLIYMIQMSMLFAGKGGDVMGIVMCGVFVGGIFHACLAPFIGKIRFALPPLVTGLVVTMLGLTLVKVGIQYAAGGVPAIGKPEYGSLQNWSVALVVIFTTLGFKFFTRGLLSVAAI